jgi:hypothetical protein
VQQNWAQEDLFVLELFSEVAGLTEEYGDEKGMDLSSWLRGGI